MRVRFSEPVNPITVTAATLHVDGGGLSPVPATFSFSNDNSEVVLTPLAALPPGATMTVVVDGIEDPAGHRVAAQSKTFTTAAAPDFTAPQAVALAPFSGEADVPVNAVITVEFSEPIELPSTGAANDVSLYDYSTGFVPITASLSPDGRTLMVVPAGGLAASRSFAFGVSFRDASGNVNSWSFGFSTAAASDTTAPRVVATIPGDGLAAVPRNAAIQVLFDEPIDATRLDGVSLAAVGQPVPFTRSLSNGNRMLTLTPPVLLSSDTVYVLSIGGIADAAGNPLVGPITVTFTAGTSIDLAGPSVTALNPADGATNVATGTAIQVAFDERLNVLSAGSGAAVLRVWATNEVVPAAISFSSDLRTLVVTPAAPLAASTIYQVVVNYVTDLAGNGLRNQAWSTFTTAP